MPKGPLTQDLARSCPRSGFGTMTTFQKQAMPFTTTQKFYPASSHLASPETPTTCSFQAPTSLPTPMQSPDRPGGGPFHQTIDFPHYKRFEPPTPTPASADEQSSPIEKPLPPSSTTTTTSVKRKPGRPPKSAAQKAADAAARKKAAAALKKEAANSSNTSSSSARPKPARTGNPRGRPSKQQQQHLNASSPANKNDSALPETEMVCFYTHCFFVSTTNIPRLFKLTGVGPSLIKTPAQSHYAASGPLGVGAHTPPAESELKAKRRRLWAPGQGPDQQPSPSFIAALGSLPSPPTSSGSESSASSSSGSATLQRRIDPATGSCVYVAAESATPSLASSVSTSTSTSSLPPSAPALQYLAQRLEHSEGMVKAVIEGYGSFLIHWSDLRERLGLEESLEAVAAGINCHARDSPDALCDKILRRYCTASMSSSLLSSRPSQQQREERAQRFQKWLEEEDVEEDQEQKEQQQQQDLMTSSSSTSTLIASPTIVEEKTSRALEGMRGGKSLGPLQHQFQSRVEPTSQLLASVSEIDNKEPNQADDDLDDDEEDEEEETTQAGESQRLDAPFDLDHRLSQSPQSVDHLRSLSNTTPANGGQAYPSSLSFGKPGQGPSLQPILVESSPVARQTPKPVYGHPHHLGHHERRVSWGPFQHELLPPFPSTPPPSGDLYSDARGRLQRARQISNTKGGGFDMFERFDMSGPELHSPGSFIPDITATPDRGAMAQQLGLFPASSMAGVTYTPGPFSR